MRWMVVFVMLVLFGCGKDVAPVAPPDCPDSPLCPIVPGPVPSPDPSPSPSPTPEPSPSPSPTSPPMDVDDLFTSTADTRARVREYVRKFIEDGALEGINVVELLGQGPKLEIVIGSLDGWGSYVIGLCESSSYYRRLTLDPDYFEVQGEVASRVLFHHEMGHCVLFRDHRTETGLIPDGSQHAHALSVMYPTIMGSAQYLFHEPYYVGELFQQLSASSLVRSYVCPGL